MRGWSWGAAASRSSADGTRGFAGPVLLLSSPLLKPGSELGEMVVCVCDLSRGGVMSADGLRLGFIVPGEDAVARVDEIGDAIDDRSDHPS
jgi:hypothetical protein